MENTQETTNANKLRKARAVNNATTTADALRGDTDTASFMGEMLSLDMKMPAHPAFPFLMLILAIMKDAIDIVSLGFLGIFTSITFGIIIGI